MARRTAKYLQDGLRDVERDIVRVTAELEELKSLAASLRRGIDRYSGDTDSGDDVMEGDSEGGRMRADTKLARNALYEILAESGQPLHARDLLEALQRRGVDVRGKDPVNNVRAHLSHDLRFISVGSGKWDLASRGRNPAVSRGDDGVRREGRSGYVSSYDLKDWSQSWVAEGSPAGEKSDLDEADGPSDQELQEIDAEQAASTQGRVVYDWEKGRDTFSPTKRGR